MALKRKLAARRFDFDVNIVPIVDCLMILIIFLLASGVYVSIGMLGVTISDPSSSAAAAATDPSLLLSLQVNEDHSLLLEASGRAARKILIRQRDNHWDFKGLSQQLAVLKKAFPSVKTLTVEPQGGVSYQYVVEAMEVSRGTHPDVLLGGF